MKLWFSLVLAVCLPCGCLIAGVIWLRRRWLAHELAKVNAAIKPLSVDHYRFMGQDDSLRVRTELRRDAAARLKARAHKVESGESVSDILRVVKR